MRQRKSLISIALLRLSFALISGLEITKISGAQEDSSYKGEIAHTCARAMC
jgi:hypothetical protein